MEYEIENQNIKSIEDTKNLGQISWREIIHELLRRKLEPKERLIGHGGDI